MTKTCEGTRLDGRICGRPLQKRNQSMRCPTHRYSDVQDARTKHVGIMCDATTLKTGKPCGLYATMVVDPPHPAYRVLYRCHAHAPAAARPIRPEDRKETQT